MGNSFVVPVKVHVSRHSAVRWLCSVELIPKKRIIPRVHKSVGLTVTTIHPQRIYGHNGWGLLVMEYRAHLELSLAKVGKNAHGNIPMLHVAPQPGHVDGTG